MAKKREERSGDSEISPSNAKICEAAKPMQFP